MDGCQSWKLARVSGAGFQREFPASVSWALKSEFFRVETAHSSESVNVSTGRMLSRQAAHSVLGVAAWRCTCIPACCRMCCLLLLIHCQSQCNTLHTPLVFIRLCIVLTSPVTPEAVWQVWRHHTNLLKFGELFFRKIIKNVATRCQILRLKCTKIDLQRSPDPVAGRGFTSKERGGGERGEREEGRECKEGREGGKGETRHTNLSSLPSPLDVSIFLRLYLKPVVHISCSRSLFPVIPVSPSSLRPCSVHCSLLN